MAAVADKLSTGLCGAYHTLEGIGFHSTRFSERSAWPGSYTDSAVDLAWQAWKAKPAVQATRALPEG